MFADDTPMTEETVLSMSSSLVGLTPGLCLCLPVKQIFNLHLAHYCVNKVYVLFPGLQSGHLLSSIKSRCLCCGRELIDPHDVPEELLAHGVQVRNVTMLKRFESDQIIKQFFYFERLLEADCISQKYHNRYLLNRNVFYNFSPQQVNSIFNATNSIDQKTTVSLLILIHKMYTCVSNFIHLQCTMV